ncbi:MAG: hypothetical protein HC871_00380 [Rhizobiales bacterium]|nr:hypothetical protein [Hyphomicrobiales bacterium]
MLAATASDKTGASHAEIDMTILYIQCHAVNSTDRRRQEPQRQHEPLVGLTSAELSRFPHLPGVDVAAFHILLTLARQVDHGSLLIVFLHLATNEGDKWRRTNRSFQARGENE